MGAVGTALKAFLTVIILGGLFVAYYFVGVSFEFGPFFGIQGLVFWIALVVSALIFIWGIIPRWLTLLSWTVLVVYLSFLVSDTATGIQAEIQVYLALVLFGLFLIFLAKWIRDVRRVRRLLHGLDTETLRRVQRTVQAAQPPALALGTTGTSEGTTETTEPAPHDEGVYARRLPLDVQTVKLLRDLAIMTDRVKEEEGQEQERVLGEIRAFEERLVIRSLKSSRRGTVFSIVLFILGSAVGLAQPTIMAWIGTLV